MATATAAGRRPSPAAASVIKAGTGPGGYGSVPARYSNGAVPTTPTGGWGGTSEEARSWMARQGMGSLYGSRPLGSRIVGTRSTSPQTQYMNMGYPEGVEAARQQEAMAKQYADEAILTEQRVQDEARRAQEAAERATEYTRREEEKQEMREEEAKRLEDEAREARERAEEPRESCSTSSTMRLMRRPRPSRRVSTQEWITARRCQCPPTCAMAQAMAALVASRMARMNTTRRGLTARATARVTPTVDTTRTATHRLARGSAPATRMVESMRSTTTTEKTEHKQGDTTKNDD